MNDVIDINDQGWAKEATLKRLVDILSKNTGAGKTQAGNYINSALNKEKEKEIKLRKELNKHYEKDTKTLKGLGTEIDRNKKEFSKLSKSMDVFRTATTLLKGALMGTVAGLVATGKDLFTMSLDIERAGLSHTLKTTGEGAGDAINNMAAAARRVSMSMGAFADVIKTHSQSIGTYGVENFSIGVEQMYNSTKQFGVTTKEAANYFGEYLETQRKAGMLGKMTEADTRRGAQEAFKQNILMARAMKMSREDLRKQFEQAMGDPDAQFLLNELMAKQIPNVQKNFEMLAGLGPEFQTAAIDAAHSAAFAGTATASDSFRRLMEGGAVNTANIIAEFGSKLAAGTLTIEDVSKLQSQVQAGLLDHEADIAGILKVSQEGDYARQMINSIRHISTTFDSTALETETEADRLAKIAAEFKVAFGKISGQFQSLALELMNSTMFQEAMQWIATNGVKYITDFISFLREKIPEVRKALEGIFDFIIDVAPKLKEHWPMVVGGFGAALLAALTAPALLAGIGLAAGKAIASMAAGGLSMAGRSLASTVMALGKNINLPGLGTGAGAGRAALAARGGAVGLAGYGAWELGSMVGDALYEKIGDSDMFTNLTDSALDIATGKSSLTLEAAKWMQNSSSTRTPSGASVNPPSSRSQSTSMDGALPAPAQGNVNENTQDDAGNLINSALETIKASDSNKELLTKIHSVLEDIKRITSQITLVH